MATDIDSFIHCGTKQGDFFLIFEFKAAGVPVPLGQKIALKALERNLTNATVVVIFGPDTKNKYLVTGGWAGLWTEQKLIDRVAKWWKDHKETT